jgi:hypothetical protein
MLALFCPAASASTQTGQVHRASCSELLEQSTKSLARVSRGKRGRGAHFGVAVLLAVQYLTGLGEGQYY